VRIIVTGAAGFIGAACASRLIDRGDSVLGIDSLNDYYDVGLKQSRLNALLGCPNFEFVQADLAHGDRATKILVDWAPDVIIHLAAQAGVRASLERPFDYVQSNLVAHMVVLEATRQIRDLQHLVYASSSSVYGNRASGAFKETDRVDSPQSLYAATKRADELLSGVYCSAHGLAATGLRFFTVVGPKGRPDMAYWTFAERIMAGQPIIAYDGGQLKRDFTFIDDIVSGIIAVVNTPAAPFQHRIYNLGNNQPQSVNSLIAALETSLHTKAIVKNAPKPSYDVETTFADISSIKNDLGWSPTTNLADAIASFADWFLEWRTIQ
jgi:UDP-glucuronate 4-epimerase